MVSSPFRRALLMQSAGKRNSNLDITNQTCPSGRVATKTTVARESEIENLGFALVVGFEFGERKGQEVKGVWCITNMEE